MRTTTTRRAMRLAGIAPALAFLGCLGVADAGGGDRLMTGALASADGGVMAIQVVVFEPALATLRATGTVGSVPSDAAIQVRLRVGSGPSFDLLGTHDAWGAFQATGGGWSVRGGMDDDGAEVEVTSPTGVRTWGVVADEEPGEDSVVAGYCYCRPLGLRPTCIRCSEETVMCCAPDPVLPDPPIELPPPALFPECPPR